MTLARLPSLLAFSALTTCAIAGGNLASSQTTSSHADTGLQHTAPVLGGAAEGLPTDLDVTPRSRLLFRGTGSQNLVFAPDAQDRVPLARFRARHGHSLADMNGYVCYTMRTYKVKPTERIQDHDHFLQDYSECEMASNFQIRSAEAHEKKPHPDEPPVTLK